MPKNFHTGGAGYAGSRLVEDLIEKKNEVTVYDTMYRYGDEHLKGISNNLTLIKGDIRDIELLKNSSKS